MAPEEVVSRDVYELVLKIAALPALLFLIWLSWMIINYLFNPRWIQERRARQIRKAQAERQALMDELHAEDEAARLGSGRKSSSPKPENPPPRSQA